VSFPALVAIAGNLVCDINAKLTAVDMPNLVSIGEYLLLYDNGSLVILTLPALQTVQHVFVSGTPLIAECIVTNLVNQLTTPPVSVLVSGANPYITCP
jgi:hypothetical protein